MLQQWMRGTHGCRGVLMAVTLLLCMGALARAKVIRDSDLPEVALRPPPLIVCLCLWRLQRSPLTA